MGAWGYGVFENDDAMDWLPELLESVGMSLIEETLREVLVDDYIEADLASNAIAAAEIIAALAGKPSDEFVELLDHEEELKSWLKEQTGASAEIIELVKKAVSAVKTDSELKELWEESDEFGKWLRTIEDLEQRLSQL